MPVDLAAWPYDRCRYVGPPRNIGLSHYWGFSRRFRKHARDVTCRGSVVWFAVLMSSRSCACCVGDAPPAKSEKVLELRSAAVVKIMSAMKISQSRKGRLVLGKFLSDGNHSTTYCCGCSHCPFQASADSLRLHLQAHVSRVADTEMHSARLLFSAWVG